MFNPCFSIFFFFKDQNEIYYYHRLINPAQDVPVKIAKKKIQDKFNNLKHKLANTQTHKWVVAPIVKTIMKNNKFSFNPPEREKFKILHQLNRRLFFTIKYYVISLLPNNPRSSNPHQMHERTP